MTIGYIHSTESFGSVDGPGIRFIIFLQGCPMRCQFCHNPDTWAMMKTQPHTATDLLDQAEKYRPYWGQDGGITVSGGEPLMQIDFLIELFEMAKKRGIHTCIDTSAQPYRSVGEWHEKFKRLMGVTDVVLLDIKHINNEAHRRLTLHPNDNILACARFLSDIRKPVWIRHVLIPGITEKDEFLLELADFLSTLHNIQRIDVLPYHTLGVYKYENLGLEYLLRDTEAPSNDRLEHARSIFAKVPLMR